MGPAPAGFFLTSRIIDEIPGLKESPLGIRVREILRAAEAELFVPLLSSARPNDFGKEFSLLANRYFPVRLQTLIIILNEVGPDEFRKDYFNRAPQVAASLAMHAGQWGLSVEDVRDSFRQYFESALSIISVAPRIGLAPVPLLFRLMNSMTEIDYGFTAMGLVFEGSIPAPRWRISEVFKLARRSLLEYEDAAKSLVAQMGRTNPKQTEMFMATEQKHRNIVAIGPRAVGAAGKHLRSLGQIAKQPIGDPDSDYE